MQRNTFLAERITSEKIIRSFVTIRDAFRAQEDEIFQMLASSRAFLQGHFRLQSELHSEIAFLFRDLAGVSIRLDKIAGFLIEQFKKDKVWFDGVFCSDEAGVELSEAIVGTSGKRLLIIGNNEQHRPTRLINESSLYPNDRILIVGNTATTGRILQFMVSFLRKRKARVAGVALFAIRNKETIRELEFKERLKVYALVNLTSRIWKEADCPLCQKSEPFLNFWEI